MLSLETPIAESRLPTLAPAVTRRLREDLKITTIRDLLWRLPVRYEDRAAILPIRACAPGASVSVIGNIERLRVARTMRMKRAFAEATLRDPTGTLRAVWFNQPWMAQRLSVGDRVMLSGKIPPESRQKYLANPQYEIVQQGGTKEAGKEKHDALPSLRAFPALPLVPVYAETEGITSRWINYLIRAALTRVADLRDPIPDTIREGEGLLSLREALERAHVPSSREAAERAKEALLFRELFVLHCAVALSRAQRDAHRALALPIDAERIKRLLSSLSFRLTESQRIAAYEILRDMEKARPMRRLLVGDVGSGKTIVAAIAALNAVTSGKGQAALMAPTDVLAKQHFTTFAEILAPLRVRVALLTGSTARVTPKHIASERSIAISKPRLFREIADGTIDVLIGTHALISRPKSGARKRTHALKPQGPLRFRKLLLAVIDEQHRFGVRQRQRMEAAEHIAIETNQVEPPLDAARGKNNHPANPEMNRPILTGKTRGISTSFSVVSASNHEPVEPHLLTLTATPIPRTLALTIFGDLDVSMLTELPRGRKRIETAIIPASRETAALARIREETQRGRQAFIICPLVSESEKILTRAATKEFDRLRRGAFADLRLGLLHGQMKTKEKDTVMGEFTRGKLDVLVATPVVEVGVDVPNAAVMLVEGAERFGLAQLYQFRGRVGRGVHQSYCFFIADRLTPGVRRRLAAVERATSGSDIAEADLALRGPGEFLGAQQSGVPDTTMQAIADIPLVQRTRKAAREFLAAEGVAGITREPTLAARVRAVRAQLHLS